ncbi:MAG: biotin--[acetyl-CoA-carboxylase] ligase [Bdellovibrionota bacterium]
MSICFSQPKIVGSHQFLFELHDSLESTQTLRKKIHKEDPHSNVVVMAKHQSKGQGQRGRVWESYSEGIQLLCSCVIASPFSTQRLPMSNLLAACIWVEIVRDHLGVQTLIKWPNDLMLGGKKWGGLLSEFLDASQNMILLGMGLNLSGTPAPSLPDATSLWSEPSKASHQMGIDMVCHFLDAWQNKSMMDESELCRQIQDFFSANNAWSNQTIETDIGDGQVIVGLGNTIDDTGALLLQKKGTSNLIPIISGRIRKKGI